MRYIVLALALLVLCAGLCVWNMMRVCAILEQMETLSNEALDAVLGGDYTRCSRLLDELRRQWQHCEVYFCAVMPHKSLDTVSLGIETVTGLVQEQSGELAAQLRVLCRSLRLLMESERLHLGNVL